MATLSANSGSDVRQGMDQLKGTAEHAKECVKETGHDVLGAVQQLGADASRTVQEKVGELKDTASQYLEQGKNKAVDLEHSIEDTIRKQPLTALLVAAGLGVAIGCLINRR